jgi:SnoaL-like domain
MTDTSISDATIARLAAQGAIHRLLASYVHYVDERKFAAVAELLQHAEFDVVGKSVSSREQIHHEAAVKRHADGSPRTWHTLSKILIDIDPSGDTAKSASYFIVQPSRNRAGDNGSAAEPDDI